MSNEQKHNSPASTPFTYIFWNFDSIKKTSKPNNPSIFFFYYYFYFTFYYGFDSFLFTPINFDSHLPRSFYLTKKIT